MPRSGDAERKTPRGIRGNDPDWMVDYLSGNSTRKGTNARQVLSADEEGSRSTPQARGYGRELLRTSGAPTCGHAQTGAERLVTCRRSQRRSGEEPCPQLSSF